MSVLCGALAMASPRMVRQACGQERACPGYRVAEADSSPCLGKAGLLLNENQVDWGQALSGRGLTLTIRLS